MSNRLRPGMWVTHRGQIGICDKVEGETVSLHSVDPDGATVAVSGVPADHVAQAPYGLIPEARRPPRELAIALGYL